MLFDFESTPITEDIILVPVFEVIPVEPEDDGDEVEDGAGDGAGSGNGGDEGDDDEGGEGEGDDDEGDDDEGEEGDEEGGEEDGDEGDDDEGGDSSAGDKDEGDDSDDDDGDDKVYCPADSVNNLQKTIAGGKITINCDEGSIVWTCSANGVWNKEEDTCKVKTSNVNSSSVDESSSGKFYTQPWFLITIAVVGVIVVCLIIFGLYKLLGGSSRNSSHYDDGYDREYDDDY